MTNRSRTVRSSISIAAVVAGLVACGDPGASNGGTTSSATTGHQTRDGIALTIAHDELVRQCTAEGALNLIAIPDEWANYKGVLSSFRQLVPKVKIDIQMPVASSAQEREAVIDQHGEPTQPDVVDVSPPIAAMMATEALFDPFVPALAEDLPSGLRDAGNQWNSAYYGIIAISSNTKLVANPPTTFADLMKPEYKGQIALLGDPRQSGSAFASVMAASLANGGSADNIKPGIDFFSRLKKAGNMASASLTPATVMSGETPIAIDWSFDIPALQAQMEAAGLGVESHFPTDGIYGGMYAQGVVAGAPHPHCGRLWVEHLLSDAGANEFLAGGAIPGRYEVMSNAGSITPSHTKMLPPEGLISQVELVSPAQAVRAAKVLDTYWQKLVVDQPSP